MADPTLSPMRILVTGATGFVGAHLARRLVDDGHDVVAMTRRPRRLSRFRHADRGRHRRRGQPPRCRSTASTSRTTWCTRWPTPTSRRATGEAPRTSRTPPATPTSARSSTSGASDDEDDDLSPHLRSRREVERILLDGGAHHRPASGHRDRRRRHQLGDPSPARRAPPGHGRPHGGCRRRTQPIALDDAVAYLAGVAGRGATIGSDLRDRRSGRPDLPRHAADGRRHDGPASGHRARPRAVAAPVLVVAPPDHRRRPDHGPCTGRLDVQRGRRHRPVDRGPDQPPPDVLPHRGRDGPRRPRPRLEGGAAARADQDA